jgi:hypothetical protein
VMQVMIRPPITCRSSASLASMFCASNPHEHYLKHHLQTTASTAVQIDIFWHRGSVATSASDGGDVQVMLPAPSKVVRTNICLVRPSRYSMQYSMQ